MSLLRSHQKSMLLAGLYFAVSTVITWWFILAGKALYHDLDRMVLSCSIAGGKWALQIFAALLFLKEKRWPFLERIGFTCLIGSLILLPFCCREVQRAMGLRGFLYSITVCVAVMICLYYRSVHRTGIPMHWFWGWFSCLTIAITLQLTVVFHVV